MEFTFTEKLKIGDERIRFYGELNTDVGFSEKDRLVVTFKVILRTVSNGFNFADIYIVKVSIEHYISPRIETVLFENNAEDFVLFNNLEFQPDGCLLLSSVEVDFNHKSIDIT